MPSLAVHLVLPPLALLSIGVFRWQTVLLLLPLSLAPDADFFVGVHRASLHNVFLLAPFLFVGWRFWGEPGRHAYAEASIVAFAYLASHQLMDLFVGGVVPLWPLSDTTVLLDARILVDTATLETETTFEPATREGVPQVSPVYEFLDGTQAAILAFAGIVAGIVAAWRALVPRTEVVVVSTDAGPRTEASSAEKQK